MGTYYGLKNQKLTTGKLYCWENSDYTIDVISVGKKIATIKTWHTIRRPICIDQYGNEYVRVGMQTYYAFAKC